MNTVLWIRVLAPVLVYTIVVNSLALTELIRSTPSLDDERTAFFLKVMLAAAAGMSVSLLCRSITYRPDFFLGLRISHILAFSFSFAITWLCLPLGTDLTTFNIFVTVVSAAMEQYTFFVAIGIVVFYNNVKILPIVLIAIFVFGHRYEFSIAQLFSTLLLLPTVFRTMNDQNLWHGLVFHAIYNIGVIYGFPNASPESAGFQLWVIGIFVYSAMLILTARISTDVDVDRVSRMVFGRRSASFFAAFSVGFNFLSHEFEGLKGLKERWRYLRNNILFCKELRLLNRQYRRKKLKKYEPAKALDATEAAGISTVVFWHVVGYPTAFVRLVLAFGTPRHFVVFRRIRSARFENLIARIAAHKGHQVTMLASANEYKILLENSPKGSFIIVVGGEFFMGRLSKPFISQARRVLSMPGDALLHLALDTSDFPWEYVPKKDLLTRVESEFISAKNAKDKFLLEGVLVEN